jgi:putative membrane protein
MALLSSEDKERIRAATAAAEQNTSGEIVTVLTPASDEYHYIPALWAALAAMAVPLPLIYLADLPAWFVYTVQLLVFLVLVLVLRHPKLRHAVIPAYIRHRRAHRRAMEQFLAQNLHTTAARTGVLIFVSLGERHAEIIADEGIYAKVSPDVWDKAVTTLISHIRSGDVAGGFVAAIAMCGEVLAEHFPPGAADHDELPNAVIIL